MSSDSSEKLFADNPFGRDVQVDEVIETLGFFDDWEERYGYIIDLGKQLPAFPESMQTEDRIVHGCQSQVWLEIGHDPNKDEVLLAVDSDALIVRGLAAMILAALNHQSPAAIHDYDMEAYFDQVDLVKHLSPTRGNGLRAMVERIKQESARYTA